MALATLTPKNITGDESSDRIPTIDRFSSEYVLQRKREFINGPGFLAVQNATGPANLLGHGTGTPALAEMGSAEIAGFTFDADSESHGFLWALPDIIDLTEAIYLSVVWSETTAAVQGSALFSVVYTPIYIETTAIAIGATALDTVIVDDPDSATDDCMQETAQGIIAASTLTGKPGVDLLAMKTAVDLTTANNATYYGTRCEYARRYV